MCTKIGGAHLQCTNNHYGKFEYKWMKTVGVTDYTNQTSPTHSGWKKMSESNTRWFVGFVALRPKSTAMVIAGRSVHLTTLFPGQA